MLGNTIYKLRKEKGLSQAELGAIVGVSNKAVSKWETDEANPDIALLPELSKALGVTVDQLLSGDVYNYNEKGTDEKPVGQKETSIFGLEGIETSNYEEYEFKSKKATVNGTPYLHIHIGKSLSKINAKAHGVIAIGNIAKGIISLGFLSQGLISIGILSNGLLSFGILSLGLLAFGSFALGGIAFGAIAVGFVAMGAIAVGAYAFGAVAIGYHAYTGINGLAVGKNIHIFDFLKRHF